MKIDAYKMERAIFTGSWGWDVDIGTVYALIGLREKANESSPIKLIKSVKKRVNYDSARIVFICF